MFGLRLPNPRQMTDPRLPEAPKASDGPLPASSLDGLGAERLPTAKEVPPPPPEQVARVKKLLLILGGGLYSVYAMWLLALLVLLPSPTGSMAPLVTIGTLSAMAGAALFIVVGLFMFLRVLKAPVSVATRRMSVLKLLLVLTPGIALSAIAPFLISREPGLALDILEPQQQEDFVAPLSVTYSLERAAEILRRRGLRPILYIWDYEGDGRPNEETVLPFATAIYERQGSYTPSVRINLDDGMSRRVGRRLLIPRAVFSVSPLKPIIEKPVRFSIRHLVAKPEEVKEAMWDFDGDNEPDQVTTATDVVHTYYAVERIPVSVVVTLTNQTQVTFERMIDISKPEPPPFPVALITEPKLLMGPGPFGAVFRIDTEEPLKEVSWSFDDGPDERGQDLRRVGHVFQSPRIYPVTVKVRSASGKIAELSTLVRVTETLFLGDLRFDGEPRVEGDTIRAEVPVTVNLTAKTSVPLVEFYWEAANATSAHATGAQIQAVYRKEGTYNLTLVAQDPQGKVLRRQITLEAMPPAAAPVIQMKPPGGVAPLHVTFDASETYIPPAEEVAGFEWSFGDFSGGPSEQLSGARAEHVYEHPGEYTVTLRVLMASSKEYSTEKTIVVRKPLLDACIQASRTLVLTAGSGIQFDSFCSTGGGTAYLWDVRNTAEPALIVSQSGERSYAHVFETPGTYRVTLTVTDALGNKDSESLTVTVEP